MKYRPTLKFECAFLRPEYLGAGQIRRQQVRGELDSVELTFNTLSQHFDGCGLGQAWCAFHQQVSITKQGHNKPFHQAFLADDKLVYFLA